MEELQALDNCEIFQQIRNAFTYYNYNTKRLQSFVYFSGNEEGIKKLSAVVLSVLQEHELMQSVTDDDDDDDDDGGQIAKIVPGADLDKLRGTWMYLMLNSANNSEKHKWIPQCVHLLNQLPAQIPQFVTIGVALWSGMQEQLFEFLACGPHWLVSQYFDCFSETLSHVVSDKRQALPYVCSALSAVTKSICYPVLVGDDCSSTSSLVNNSQRLIHRNVLNGERLRALRPATVRRRYLGEALLQLMNVAIEAMQAIKTPPKLPDYYRLYALRPDSAYNRAVDQETTTAANNVVGRLQRYVGKLLDAVEVLLQQVDVETYMYWTELPSDMLLFHMQGHFCNQAKQLKLLLQVDEVLEQHSIRLLLTGFATGSQSFEERLSALTMGGLLGFLDGEMGVVNDKQLLAGLDELLKRPVAFAHDECVETMAKHVRLMGVRHAEQMLLHLALVRQMRERAALEGDTDEEEQDHMYDELLRQVLPPIFQACPTISDKLRLLQQRDRLKLLGRFTFSMEDYESRRVFFFNHLTASWRQFSMDQFLNLCYEQPERTWLSFAELAMSHASYSTLFARVGVICIHHAKHYVHCVARQLMQDERLLSQPALKGKVLSWLYETPVILGGMIYINMRQMRLNLYLPAAPYTANELRSFQAQYLSSLAAGIGKFTESGNYPALDNLVSTLLKLEDIDRHLIYNSHRCLKLERVRLLDAKRTGGPWKRQHDRLMLARSYLTMHGELFCWRRTHWELIAQLIRTMDTLRGTMDDFMPTRMMLLDDIMSYYAKCIPHALQLSPDLKRKVKELVETLRYKEMWQGEQLATLLGEPKPRSPQEYAMLLPKTSSLEAVKLLGDAIEQRSDHAVMTELAQAVDLSLATNPMSQALKMYGFLFKCYMRAFKTTLITSAKPSEYPYLIQHLLQVPKLQQPENLLAAVDNFKILLAPKVRVDTATILEIANLKLGRTTKIN